MVDCHETIAMLQWFLKTSRFPTNAVLNIFYMLRITKMAILWNCDVTSDKFNIELLLVEVMYRNVSLKCSPCVIINSTC